MKKTVFAVEDDQSIRDLYKLTFEGSGFGIETFETAEEILIALDSSTPDCIIMDLMLPGMDGIEAVKKIRSNPVFHKVPIIIISAKGDEVSKVNGFEAGADDYVAKPFGVLELVARVKANIRQNQAPDSADVLTSGDIVMNNTQHTVTVCGYAVQLTLKEYSLLKEFMQNENILISRAQLLSDIWGFDFDADTRTLDMHIMSLRNKIADCTPAKYIHTVRGAGYKFFKQQNR